MLEFPKIETLYERDEKTHKLKQSLVLKSEAYGLVKTYSFTEKVDGTSIRCMWQPVDSRGPEFDGSLTFGGRTENAQIHADLVKWLYENVSKEKLRTVFPESPAILFGEGYGAGIQKGGGYSPIKKLILFDVFVLDPENRLGGWWLNRENMRDVADKLGLDRVPYLGEFSLESATELVRKGFSSAIPGAQCQAEGLVGRTAETLYDKRGHRLIVKLKTKDF